MGSFSLFSLFYDHVLTTCQATTPAAHFLGRPTFADLPFAMRMLWAGYVAGHYKQARMYSHFRWVMGKSDHPLPTRALHLGAHGGLHSAGASHTTLRRTWQRARLGLPAKMRFGQTSWAHQEWEDIPPRTVHSVVSTMVLYWIPLFSGDSEKIKYASTGRNYSRPTKVALRAWQVNA